MKVSAPLSIAGAGAMFIAADRRLVALAPPVAVPSRPSPFEDDI
jgi:hypothetical protein